MLPYIKETIPQNDATQVSLTQPIILTFDQKLDPMSIGNSTVIVTNINTNQTINDEVSINLNAESTAIEITPLTNWPYMTDIKVMIRDVVSWNLERMLGTTELLFTTENQEVNPDEDPDNPPVPPTYSIETILNINSKYITNDKLTIIVTAQLNNEIVNDVVTSISLSDLNSIYLIENNGYNDTDEALAFGSKMFVFNENNTKLFKNRIIIDFAKMCKDEVITGGKEYFLYVTQLSADTEEGIPLTLDELSTLVCPLNPMYASTESIFNFFSMMNMPEAVSKDVISLKIYDNSRLAEYIVAQEENTNIVFSPPSMAVIKFVEEKTKYDLMFTRYTSISSTAKKQKLDALEIDYGHTINELISMLNKLKDSYLKWENMLAGTRGINKAKMSTFSRGSSVDQMPAYMSSRAVRGW